MKKQFIELNNLKKTLSQTKIFDNEYDLLLSLLDIYEYILNDEKLSVVQYDFLSDLTKDFFKIYDFKAEHKNEIPSNKSLNDKYEELINDFLRGEQYFYVHIYNGSEHYDGKFLGPISNLLLKEEQYRRMD